jgi:hypothetical protein
MSSRPASRAIGALCDLIGGRISASPAGCRVVRGHENLRTRRCNWSTRRPLTSWPGLSRPSTRRRRSQRLKGLTAYGRGCPAQGHGCPVELKSPVTRENLSGIEPLGVLAGLVPAIHAEPLQETFKVGVFRTAWMPGTSPGTTRGVVCDLRFTTDLAEPDSRGTRPGTTCWGCKGRSHATEFCCSDSRATR